MLGNGTTSNVATGVTTSVGKIGIGTTTPDPNTILDVYSSNKGVLLPLLTADPTIVAGLLYYNTGTLDSCFYSILFTSVISSTL